MSEGGISTENSNLKLMQEQMSILRERSLLLGTRGAGGNEVGGGDKNVSERTLRGGGQSLSAIKSNIK